MIDLASNASISVIWAVYTRLSPSLLNFFYGTSAMLKISSDCRYPGYELPCYGKTMGVLLESPGFIMMVFVYFTNYAFLPSFVNTFLS